jgi:hypothetical protein
VHPISRASVPSLEEPSPRKKHSLFFLQNHISYLIKYPIGLIKILNIKQVFPRYFGMNLKVYLEHNKNIDKILQEYKPDILASFDE